MEERYHDFGGGGRSGHGMTGYELQMLRQCWREIRISVGQVRPVNDATLVKGRSHDFAQGIPVPFSISFPFSPFFPFFPFSPFEGSNCVCFMQFYTLRSWECFVKFLSMKHRGFLPYDFMSKKREIG